VGILEQNRKLVTLGIKTVRDETGSDGTGSRAWRDSLKKNQHRVRGIVWHAGQGRPLDTDILTLPSGWMVAAEWNQFRAPAICRVTPFVDKGSPPAGFVTEPNTKRPGRRC
jgi:hypothetical protein